MLNLNTSSSVPIRLVEPSLFFASDWGRRGRAETPCHEPRQKRIPAVGCLDAALVGEALKLFRRIDRGNSVIRGRRPVAELTLEQAVAVATALKVRGNDKGARRVLRRWHHLHPSSVH